MGTRVIGHDIAHAVRSIVLVASVVLAGVVIVLANKIAHRKASCVEATSVAPTVFAPPPRHRAPRLIFSSHRLYPSKSQGKTRLSLHEGNIRSVNRQIDPELEHRTAVTIPQTIWQTARSHDNNPRFGTELYNTWTKQHPNWDHYFLDDAEVDAFVAAHYNRTVLQAFRDMPLGVMRADVFRYAFAMVACTATPSRTCLVLPCLILGM